MGSYQVDVTPKIPNGRDVAFAGHWNAAEHFVKVLRGEEAMIVKKDEVLNVIRALDALYRSSEEDREIRLD
jgi:predicted dehydrogenase